VRRGREGEEQNGNFLSQEKKKEERDQRHFAAGMLGREPDRVCRRGNSDPAGGREKKGKSVDVKSTKRGKKKRRD